MVVLSHLLWVKIISRQTIALAQRACVIDQCCHIILSEPFRHARDEDLLWAVELVERGISFQLKNKLKATPLQGFSPIKVKSLGELVLLHH